MAVFYVRGENGRFVEVPTLVGNSAYQVAVKSGFEGSEEEWLRSLCGEDGFSPTVEVNRSGNVTTVSFTDKDGKKVVTIEDGKDGKTPVKGTDYWTPDDKEEIETYVDNEIIGATVRVYNENATLTAKDAGKFILASDATITIPANVFAVGVEIEIFRYGGAVHISVGSNVLLAIPGNTSLVSGVKKSIRDQYTSVVLKQIETNVWSLQGAIE